MKEIREGVREYIHQAQGFIEGCCPVDDITDKILSYLHSQGVVIKVDRELPQITPAEYPVVPEAIVAQRTQQDMLEAGYVAVEPIIEEDK